VTRANIPNPMSFLYPMGGLVGCSDKQFIDDGLRTWSKALGYNGTFSKHGL